MNNTGVILRCRALKLSPTSLRSEVRLPFSIVSLRCRVTMSAVTPPGGSNDPSSSGAATDSNSLREIKLPKTGYFSLADTEQEVYSKATERFDPSKKGGRYKSEFIWNTNWQETLKRDEDLDRKRQLFLDAEKSGVDKNDGSGAISFSLVSDLNRMDIDMSEALKKKKKPLIPQKSGSVGSAAIGGGARNSSTIRKPVGTGRSGPFVDQPISRLNAEKLKRTTRITKSATLTVVSTKTEDEIERDRIIEEARVKYEQQKVDFAVWTLALSALGGVATYTSYSPDVAASYMVGALAGFIYLRLLSKSVDAVGAQDVGGGISSITSQQRLLIPLILALVFNRWNQLYAERFDITLQLLPMLTGFFTYKIAVIGRESKEFLDELKPKPKEPEGSENL